MYKRLIVLAVTLLALGVMSGCGDQNKQKSAEENESAVDTSTADSDSIQMDSYDEHINIGTSAEDFGPAYLSCVLPKSFKEDPDDEGMYVNKNYPNDLATISYDISDNYDISIAELTQDVYQNARESDFLKDYGDAVTVNIKSYKQVNVDGRDGLRILVEYQFKGTDYEQLSYIIYNGDELHCLTFTQEKDAGWMDEFEACSETLHFVAIEG